MMAVPRLVLVVFVPGLYSTLFSAVLVYSWALSQFK